MLAACAAAAHAVRDGLPFRSAGPAHAQAAAVSGSLAMSNSRAGAAILGASAMRPGDVVSGEVTIANTGDLAGRFEPGTAPIAEQPGTGGGRLSARLLLQVLDVTDPAAPARGGLDRFDRRDLGTFAGGQARTHRFLASFPDGGGAADNVYAGASSAATFLWTVTATEVTRSGGAAVPVPVPPVPAVKSRTTSVFASGARIDLTLPRTSVPRGGVFRARLGWRKGNLFAKVRRTDFYANARRVRRGTPNAPGLELGGARAERSSADTSGRPWQGYGTDVPAVFQEPERAAEVAVARETSAQPRRPAHPLPYNPRQRCRPVHGRTPAGRGGALLSAPRSCGRSEPGSTAWSSGVAVFRSCLPWRLLRGLQGPGAKSFLMSSAKGSGSVDLATLDNGLKVAGFCASIGVSVTAETTSVAQTFEGSGLVSKRDPSPETYSVAVGPEVLTTGFGFPFSESGHLDLVGRDKALGGKLAHIAVGGSFDNDTGCRFWGTITPTT